MNAAVIDVRPVRTKKEQEVFLHVPWSVGMDQEKNWVPPLLDDYRKQLDPKKSVFLAHGEIECWTAFEGGKPVGRISAQIDFDFDKTWPADPRTAFFGFFECADKPEVAKALFAVAEAWARKKGRVRMRGPFTLDSKGEAGVLIEGFEKPSMIGTTASGRLRPRSVSTMRRMNCPPCRWVRSPLNSAVRTPPMCR